MSKTITIRGKVLFFEFAKECSKERFDELFSTFKPSVRAEAWSELLKATNRRDESPKETPKQKEIKPKAKRRYKKTD